jgi:hypothetical protein
MKGEKHMGYYTYYTMEAVDTKTNGPLSTEREREICERLVAISQGAVWDAKTFDEVLCESMKWYDHQDNMIDLSKEFPDVMFMLEGEGEERDDNWRLYVCNGEWELCTAKIVFEVPGYEKFKNMYY